MSATITVALPGSHRIVCAEIADPTIPFDVLTGIGAAMATSLNAGEFYVGIGGDETTYIRTEKCWKLVTATEVF